MSARWSLVAALGWLVTAGCGAVEPARNPTGAPSARELRVLDATLDASRWLDASARVAAAAGAGALQPLSAAMAAEGDRIGGFVELGAEACLLGIARPGPSVADVDLFVFSDGGDLLAADESPAPEASVLVCPPHPERMYVVARVVAGTGIVAVGAMPVSPSAVAAVARAIEVRGQPGQDTGKLEGWPGLEAKIRDRRRALGSSWEDVRRTLLPVEPRTVTAFSLGVGAERCIDVLVAPGEAVHGIELAVTDAKGRVVARADAPGRDRALVLCAHAQQSLTLQIRPLASAGVVAVVVGQAPVGAAGELRDARFVDPVAPTATLGEATARLHERTRGLRFGAGRLIGSANHHVDARTARAELWSEQGEQLAWAQGSESATLFRCGPAGVAQAEVLAEQLPGPFTIELREDPKPPPLLLLQPLAAARLLARLEVSHGPVDADRLGSAVAVALGTATRTIVPIAVPADLCVEVFAALDGAARGLELRLADESNGKVEVSLGDTVASTRLCASAEPKRARVELRSTRAEARGLLLQQSTQADARRALPR
jgi:hypothetical protein